METVSTTPATCFLVLLFSLIMMIISIFTPRTAWFSKVKTKPRGALTWLAVAVLALVVGGAAYTGSAPYFEAADLEVREPSIDLDVEATRKAMTARAEEVKPELADLLSELEALRETPQFRELGFSADNQAAADWKRRAEEARDYLEGDESLPPQVKAVPEALLSLGQNYIWQNSGADNADNIEGDLAQIEAGLNWKWDED
jgi:hypothetical protein